MKPGPAVSKDEALWKSCACCFASLCCVRWFSATAEGRLESSLRLRDTLCMSMMGTFQTSIPWHKSPFNSNGMRPSPGQVGLNSIQSLHFILCLILKEETDRAASWGLNLCFKQFVLMYLFFVYAPSTVPKRLRVPYYRLRNLYSAGVDHLYEDFLTNLLMSNKWCGSFLLPAHE